MFLSHPYPRPLFSLSIKTHTHRHCKEAYWPLNVSERNLKTIMSIALSYFKKKSQNFTKSSYQYDMCKYSKRGFIQMNWSMILSTGEPKLELFIACCYNIFVFWSWGSHYMCLILNQERKCMRVAKIQAWFSEGWGPLPQFPYKEKVWVSNLGPCKNQITKIWPNLRLPLFYTSTYSWIYQGIWPNSMSPIFVLIQS